MSKYDPPQCQKCVAHWRKEGRSMGDFLKVSKGGHLPGVHDQPPYGKVPPGGGESGSRPINTKSPDGKDKPRGGESGSRPINTKIPEGKAKPRGGESGSQPTNTKTSEGKEKKQGEVKNKRSDSGEVNNKRSDSGGSSSNPAMKVAIGKKTK